MKKRLLSLCLAVVMVLGMLPMTALAAGTELTVSTSSSGYTQVNIIEQSVGSGKLQYFQVYLQSTYGKVSVDSATQDGMTIDVVLAEGTDPSAALQVGFNGTGLGFPQTQSGNKCTLENGSGAMTCTYTSAGNSVTYTINFTTAGNGEGEGEGEDPLATLSFTTDLSEEEVKCTVGDTVEALVVAAEQSKGESVSYQWYSNSTNSTEGATAIAEATSASYTPVTNDAGTTYYYVVATCGELTATSKAAKITVEKAEEEEIVLAATCNNYAVSFTVGGATVKSASTTPNGNNGTLELVVTDVTGSTVNVTAAFSKYNVPMVRFSSGFTSNVNVSAGSGTKSETVLACQPNGQPMGNLGTWTINVTVSDYEAPATLGFTTNLNEDTVTYTVGDTVEALVVAAEQSKGESVSYQWYSNSTNSTEGATAIADATSASYTPDTTAAGTTYYYAVATCGDLSATSEIAAVVVEEAKEIILSATSEYYTITFEVEGATVVSAQPTVSGYGGTLQLDVKDVTTADNKIKVTPTVTGGSYDTDVYYVTLNLSSGSGENSFEIWDVAAGFPTNKVGEWKIKAVVVDETNPATVSFTKDLSEDEVKYVVGKTASALTVKAVQSRGEAVSYQWYKNSSKSTEGAAAIEGANSASYTPDTAAVGTTYYYAVATSGELTVTSKIAMITVEAPAALTITTDLNEDEVKYTVGDSAEALTVVAEQSKGEAVSYQWYKNTTKSTEGATAIAGATSASYTPSTTETGTTYYYAVATCGELTATSKIAMITVEEMEEAPQVTFSVSANNQLIIGKDADQTLMGNVSASFEDIKATSADMMRNYFSSYINEENTTALELILHALKLYYNGGQDIVPNDLGYFDGDNVGLPLGYTESDSDWDGINDTIILEDLWGYGNAQGMNYPAAIEIFVNGAPQVSVDYNSGMVITTSPNKIVLNEGDHVDIAIFPFYDSISATYLRYFADSEGKFGNAFSVNSGEDLSLQALQTFCDKYGGVYGVSGETYVEPNPTGYVYYGLSPFSADASQIDTDMTTGGFTLTKENLHTPGTWYVWMQDEPGMGTLSHPAFAVITVVGDEESEEPTEPSVLALDIITSNGSVNSVKFTDEGDNVIEGLTAVLEDTTIKVSVPRSVGPTGKIMATFDLTQNSDGLPFLTTKTGTSGTSSGKAVNNKFTAKTTTLSGGEATFTFYLYNSVPKVVSNYYTTYKINYVMANTAPELTDAAAKSDTGVAGTAYELNVPALFRDPDGDAMTYKVSVDGAAAVAAELNENGIYSYTTMDAGTHTLVFTAHDAYNGVSEAYTLTIEIANSAVTYDVTVNVPAGVTPTFYYTADVQDGTTLETTTADNVYTVKVPENVSVLAWRYDGMGMSTAVSAENNELTLVKTDYVVKAGENEDTGAMVTVKYDDQTAVGKDNSFLLLSTSNYTVSVEAGNDHTANWKDATLTDQAAVSGQVVINLESKDIPIVVPYFAELTVYQPTTRQGVHPTAVIQPTKSSGPDYAAGTTTYYYNLSNGTVYEYRVSVPETNVNCDKYVTFVGMFKKSDTTSITVTAEQIEDGTNGRATVDHELEPYTNGALDSANVADLYMNVNAQGYLKMTQGATKDLYTARSWWATNCGGWAMKTYYFLEPDYTYTVVDLDGQPSSDVVTIDENGKITAVGNGTAIVLVTYDAMNVDIDDELYRESGPEKPLNDGFFSAIWPENTGVFVVSVGAEDSGITTGMTINEDKILGNKTAGKNLDAELDVIYFIGDQGEYTFTPGTEGVTVSVANPAISNNVLNFSGFTTLTAAEDGSYIVPLTAGRNIVKVEKDGKAEYQVVTAKSVSVTVNDKPLDEAVVAPGEEVSIVFDTLYTPVNRMALYNTGAAVVYSNVSGWDGKTAGNYRGGMGFYFFASHAPHQTVANFNSAATDGSSYGNNAVTLGDTLTVPADFAEPYFTLSDGAFSVGGFSKFNMGDHRTAMGQAPSSGGSNNIIAFFGQLPEISIPTAALESIRVTTQPTTVSYAIGDVFDPAGMVVTATYSNAAGSFTKNITDFTYDPDAFDESGTKQVKISYTFNGVTKTDTVEIEVAEVELISIEVTTQPSKTSYKLGENFDPAGMVITATYSDNSTCMITDYTYAPDVIAKDTTAVTVTYGSKSVDVPVSVSLVERLEITTQPTKKNYTEGERFDSSGMVVKAFYTDGSSFETDKYDWSPAGQLSPSDTTVTVTYNGSEGAANLQPATVSITVEKKQEESKPEQIKFIMVYMTFVNRGSIVVQDAPVVIYDEDKDGIYSIGDAFLALHRDYYPGGESGYAEISGNGVSGWVSKFWGSGDGTFTYAHNHSWASSTNNSIYDGDSIAAINGVDSEFYSDLYTWFESSSYSALTEQDETFTVNGLNLMGSSASYDALHPPVGADVTVYRSGSEVSGMGTTVDEDGRFSLYFEETGTYTVKISGTAAWGNYTDAPVAPCTCTVYVYENPTPEKKPEEKPNETPADTVTPEIEADANGEARVEISTDAVADALEQAVSEGKDSVVVTPVVKGESSVVTVELPKDAVDNITENSDMNLKVETPAASVTISNAGLAELTSQKDGSMSVSVETVKDENGDSTGEIRINVAVDNESVANVSGGIAVTVLVEEVSPGSVLVVVHSDGTETVVKKSIVAENGVTALLNGSAAVKVVDNSKKFVDVEPEIWYADGVDFVSSRELYNGVGNDRFDPAGDMTRGMLVTVLHRLEDEMEHNYEGTFHDVEEDNWYTDAIHWAADHNIVGGYGNGYFGTHDNITREQMVTMVFRYLNWLGMDTTARGDLSFFADNTEISDWAVEAMEWGIGVGIIDGVGNALVDPGSNATRAQVAVFMQRVIGQMAK